MEQVAKTIKPGIFSVQVAADNRRDEFDYKNEVIVTNKTPVDFVFIGDSITHMWELNAYFGANGRLILNRGIGGDVTEYVFKRFEADVIQLYPKYAIMKIGVNDTWSLDGDIGQGKVGDSPEVITEKVLKNISCIIEFAHKHNQKLILCSILPTNVPIFQTPKNSERNQLIVELNKELKSLADKNNIIFVDYHSHLVGSDVKTLRDGLSIDGLHPHVLGYNIMAKVLRETLAKHGIQI